MLDILTINRRTNMPKPKTPTQPGTAFGGGFYAGRFYIGADAYAQIVAPKAEGEIKAMVWNNTLNSVVGATSYCDGLANTKAMAKAGSALAKKILKLKIGGYDDWHLPSRLQSLLAFHEHAAAEHFAPGGSESYEREWHWTSTQHAEYAVYAWVQGFNYGYQYGDHKASEWRARAVRMIKL